jgi:hypothetical protein
MVEVEAEAGFKLSTLIIAMICLMIEIAWRSASRRHDVVTKTFIIYIHHKFALIESKRIHISIYHIYFK